LYYAGVVMVVMTTMVISHDLVLIRSSINHALLGTAVQCAAVKKLLYSLAFLLVLASRRQKTTAAV
jgi:hypothetical protein